MRGGDWKRGGAVGERGVWMGWEENREKGKRKGRGRSVEEKLWGREERRRGREREEREEE